MQRNPVVALLSCVWLLSVGCSKEAKENDFFIFDFGTQGRMVQQGFLPERKEGVVSDQDFDGHIISSADGRFEMKTVYSGGSYSLNELIAEGVKAIKLRGTTKKEIFVASSYYDHSSEKQIVLFVKNIGKGEINYTQQIEEMLALKAKGESKLPTDTSQP
jgi:hypothetical protein